MDTLEIFGLEYTNVAGFKATDDNNNILTYIRPSGTLTLTDNQANTDCTAYAYVTVAIPTGGGGSGVSGTFTPSSNLRSVTLSDCIGKTNIVIYPKFNISTVSTRTHWGAVIIGGKTIMQGSTNTAGNSYVFVGTMSAETGAVGNPDTFDGTTGEVKIVASSGGNYGGYFLSGQTYGYIAW